ncbi:MULTISPECIES: hypothetical protein [Prochlorococcus]|nr:MULTISPECIES: hypothetical protein [Prochlorococcus]
MVITPDSSFDTHTWFEINRLASRWIDSNQNSVFIAIAIAASD